MDETRDNIGKIVEGMQAVARVVSSSYGPRGCGILLDRASGHLSTRDGVTIAREVYPDDPAAKAGAALIIEASSRTNDQAGDGTSATALVGAAAAGFVRKLVSQGHHPAVISRGMGEAAERAVAELAGLARPLDGFDELEAFASAVAGGDAAVGRALREAIAMVGQDGTVTIEADMGTGIDVRMEEGTSFQTTLCSQEFLPEGGERVLVEPLVAVVLGRLGATEDVLSMLQAAAGVPGHPLLILAEDVSQQALQTCLLNDRRGDLRVVCARPPGIGDWRQRYLRDMAALASADLVDPARGDDPRAWKVEWFGMLKSASVTKSRTVLHAKDEAAETIQARQAEIEGELAGAELDYDLDRHAERLAALGGSLCVIRVGGMTEAEARARRSVVEDALCACRGALEDGVVPGGGLAYLMASQALGDDPGSLVVKEALLEPLRVLCSRAGEVFAPKLEHLRGLLDSGEPIDPPSWDSARAARAAILNGVSAASMGACAGHFLRVKSNYR